MVYQLRQLHIIMAEIATHQSILTDRLMISKLPAQHSNIAFLKSTFYNDKST
jgi:hypothetical protein